MPYVSTGRVSSPRQIIDALNRLISECRNLDRAMTDHLVGHTDGDPDPGGGLGLAARRVEVNVGATPTPEHTWTVIDPAVTPSSAVIATVSAATPTGKAADDVPMDAYALSTEGGGGQLTFTLRSLDGRLHDRYLVDYLILGAT